MSKNLHPVAIFTCRPQSEGKGTGKVVPLLKQAPHHENLWESGGIAPHIPKLVTRWE